jgi:hypothetical protein
MLAKLQETLNQFFVIHVVGTSSVRAEKNQHVLKKIEQSKLLINYLDKVTFHI